MHECNAHFGVLSISSLTSWDVTIGVPIYDADLYIIWYVNGMQHQDMITGVAVWPCMTVQPNLSWSRMQ
jgi:hypothetical protein